MGNQTTSFTRFFEAAHEGFYIGTLDGSGSTTEAANARLKLVLGYPPETPEWLVLPFDPERFVDADARLAFLGRLQKSGAVADHLLRLRRLDNSVAWVEVTAAAEHTDEGRLRVEAVVRDVGERRRLDNQSRDIQTELLQAEKMAALGHTISGVAHELNNPAGDDPVLGGAPVGAARGREDQARTWPSSSAKPSGPPASSAIC